MAAIILADDGVPFDGTSLEAGPLGGAETAFIGLAEGLAARGHRVLALTRTTRAFTRHGVEWRPLSGVVPESADLYIANRGHRVLELVRASRRVAFWVHNPASYLLKARYLLRLLRRRPIMVFLGPAHAATYPAWGPGRRMVIPYGISEDFRKVAERAPAGPRAVFTSNPLRRLDWVLDRWAMAIQPRVPGAELRIFSSFTTYGGGSLEKRAQAEPILQRARALAAAGVILCPPLAKPALAQELAAARVFLYGGDPGETFCLAAAESQAAGVPGVVCRSTCLDERIASGETGFVVGDDDVDGFAARAVELLSDDALWLRQHRACLRRQRGLCWTDVAGIWETLLPQ